MIKGPYLAYLSLGIAKKPTNSLSKSRVFTFSFSPSLVLVFLSCVSSSPSIDGNVELYIEEIRNSRRPDAKVEGKQQTMTSRNMIMEKNSVCLHVLSPKFSSFVELFRLVFVCDCPRVSERSLKSCQVEVELCQRRRWWERKDGAELWLELGSGRRSPRGE